MWHRPQCNIGPGISPVTIGTIDDSRKRPRSPGLASSIPHRRGHDVMTPTGCLEPSPLLWSLWRPSRQALHTPCSLLISGGASTTRVVASTGRITVKTSTSAAPTVLGVSTGCLSRPSKNLADILRLQSLRDRRFLARTLTR